MNDPESKVQEVRLCDFPLKPLPFLRDGKLFNKVLLGPLAQLKFAEYLKCTHSKPPDLIDHNWLSLN